MGIDPSIILGVKQPQLDNPLDTAKSVMGMQQAQYQNQMMQRQMSDDQATRSAYQQAMTAGPDGTPTLDKQKLLSNLPPMLAYKQQQELAKQDAEMNDRQLKVMSDHIQARKVGMNAVPTSDQANPQQQQAAWTNMIGELQKAGLPTDMYPSQYPGDQSRNGMMASLMSSEEKLAQHNKETDQQTERAKANAALAEAGQAPLPGIGGSSNQGKGGGKAPAGGPAGTGGFNPPPKMRQKAIEDYSNAVNGSRQQADATQALKDVQAGQKLSEIASLASDGDLNKLNNQQMKLAITEVVKMAGGSVPTEGELEKMTPDNYAQKYAGYLQKLTNKSQPANAGEFIQQAIDYAGGIQKLGAQKLADRSSELADRHRPYLGEQQYKLIKGQIADEFKKNSPSARAAAPGQVLKTHEIEWAN